MACKDAEFSGLTKVAKPSLYRQSDKSDEILVVFMGVGCVVTRMARFIFAYLYGLKSATHRFPDSLTASDEQRRQAA